MFYSNRFQNVFLFLLILSSLSNCYRRIKNGQAVENEKSYMVYFIRAPEVPGTPQYDYWICGGAIVSPDFIVTSAACVTDVQYMYAIAGTKTYVNIQDIDSNECAKDMKKKVVFTCVPKYYNFSYHKIEEWANIDIAVVKVESPYDFNSGDWKSKCDWTPNKIAVNYDAKYQRPDTDAMVLGWGHKEKFRMPSDKIDYNEKELKYNTIRLQDEKVCLDAYKNISGMETIIPKYMICAMGEGNINSKGDTISEIKSDLSGCGNNSVRVGDKCFQDVEMNETVTIKSIKAEYQVDLEELKKQYEYELNKRKPKPTVVDQNDNSGEVTFEDVVSMAVRRQDAEAEEVEPTWNTGICQNDHGGPLITWVGLHEVLIGVASVFMLNKNMECVGPYLFTSTYCNGKFLDCVISMFDTAPNPYDNPMTTTTTTTITTTTKKAMLRDELRIHYSSFRRHPSCDLPAIERGYDIIERRISWANHPDGPAENELLEEPAVKVYP